MDENKPLSMQDVIDYWKKIAESDYATLWYRLYNYINDMSFGIAPDERHKGTERMIRQVKYETLTAILDVMIEFEQEERRGEDNE